MSFTTSLETLSNEFNATLNEYQETSKKYTEAVTAKNSTFIPLPKYTFIGESQKNTNLNASNVTACQTACSANKLCSGANFDTTLNRCTLVSGEGKMVPNNNSTAIVMQTMYYSNKLKELNEKMTHLNEEMMNVSSRSYSTYNKNITQGQEQEKIMAKNHTILLEERGKINSMMNQYQTIDAAYEDSNTIANANYGKYIVFMLVVVLFILLFMRFAFSGPQYGGGHRKGWNTNCMVLFFLFFCFLLYFFRYN
jgi:hypothetical protein